MPRRQEAWLELHERYGLPSRWKLLLCSDLHDDGIELWVGYRQARANRVACAWSKRLGIDIRTFSATSTRCL